MKDIERSISILGIHHTTMVSALSLPSSVERLRNSIESSPSFVHV